MWPSPVVKPPYGAIEGCLSPLAQVLCSVDRVHEGNRHPIGRRVEKRYLYPLPLPVLDRRYSACWMPMTAFMLAPMSHTGPRSFRERRGLR